MPPSPPDSNPALPEPLPPEPFRLVKAWLDEASRLRLQPNPNAMSLATIDPDGAPSVRIVLCKALDPAAGSLVFYTNYTGRKGRALEANPAAAVCFHWDHLDRQVRIEGLVTRSPREESDAYFASRPWTSRAGAWASDQSRPIESRAALVERFRDAERRFGIDPDHPPARDAALDIPRPPHWGGYRLHARRVELWVGGEGRMHDRAEWVRTLTPGPEGAGPWRSTRLQP